MDRATQRVLGFTCLLIVTQTCPESAAAAEEPTLRTGDLVVVVFENGTSWSAGHATRVPAIVTAVDAKGTISINSNRTTYKDGWLRQQSLSGTILRRKRQTRQADCVRRRCVAETRYHRNSHVAIARSSAQSSKVSSPSRLDPFDHNGLRRNRHGPQGSTTRFESIAQRRRRGVKRPSSVG